MEVLAGNVDALSGRAEAVTHREPHVPEELEDLFHEAPHRVGGAPSMEEEQVDVREGGELAPPVSAERHHCDLSEVALRGAARFRRHELADAGEDEIHVAAAGRCDLLP